MPDPQHDLGVVSSVVADALGEPGQREFRLRVSGPGGFALIWLEKQLLQELAVAIHRLLGTTAASGDPVDAAPPTAAEADLEFRAGSVSLGYEEETHLLTIDLQERGVLDDIPLVRFSGTRLQAKDFAEQALEVCAGGRPLCPLCHAPLDEGVEHTCPITNGYHKV